MRSLRTDLLSALLLLPTCTPDVKQPDYRSQHGVNYYWEESTFNTDQVNVQEAFFFKNVGMPNDADLIKVIVRKDPFECGRVLANGCQVGPTLYVRDLDGCVSHTALTHEMGHWMWDDPGHVNTKLWEIADAHAFECETDGGMK